MYGLEWRLGVRAGRPRAIGRALAEAGVNFESRIGDHSNRLILVVDRCDHAAEAAAQRSPWR